MNIEKCWSVEVDFILSDLEIERLYHEIRLDSLKTRLLRIQPLCNSHRQIVKEWEFNEANYWTKIAYKQLANTNAVQVWRTGQTYAEPSCAPVQSNCLDLTNPPPPYGFYNSKMGCSNNNNNGTTKTQL